MPPRDARHEAIYALLTQAGRLAVDDLAVQLSVTPMTIRRDLAAMETAGLLTRTHGGCILKGQLVEEIPFDEKSFRAQAQKMAIARAAVARLRSGDSVYLDTGTTALQAARILPDDLDLCIFTNNLGVALELFSRTGVEVVMPGGRLGSKSPDLSGELALARLREFRFEWALIGADALDIETAELYSADMATATLSRAAQERAGQTMAMVDSSKFDKRGRALVAQLGDGMTLVTDEDAPAHACDALEARGIQLVKAVAEQTYSIP